MKTGLSPYTYLKSMKKVPLNRYQALTSRTNTDKVVQIPINSEN
jgi:hypothetical protein